MNNKYRLFSDEMMKKVRDSFYYIESDPKSGKRIFFENSGGSFRLKKCVEMQSAYEKLPDCPERTHERALELTKAQTDAEEDILKVICGANDGTVYCELTASQINFHLAEILAENIPGTNIVTSALEHPSAFDAARYSADKTGKELRVAKANPRTGGVDVDEIVSLVDKNTCFLSIMYASNISGAVMDIESIVKEARKIKPDLYVICDAVQHAPHGVMDASKMGVDALVFAPYKFFCTRGSGFSYISERLSLLRHHKLLGKAANVWELGSPTPSNFAAVTAMVDYVCMIGESEIGNGTRRALFTAGMNRLREHETALYEIMLDGTEKQKGLRNIKGVKVFFDDGDLNCKDLIIGIAIDNLDCEKAVSEYASEKITVYERVKSSIYSGRMLESLGIDGCIRVSPLHCNNLEEVEEFLAVTEKIAAKYN